mmetsp:Transcript_860/g.2392  ORF Transcript_860/g.2392 Transcript_860/m.2392 type:complete len:210 (-) Transcript_860:143-772(-)
MEAVEARKRAHAAPRFVVVEADGAVGCAQLRSVRARPRGREPVDLAGGSAVARRSGLSLELLEEFAHEGELLVVHAPKRLQALHELAVHVVHGHVAQGVIVAVVARVAVRPPRRRPECESLSLVSLPLTIHERLKHEVVACGPTRPRGPRALADAVDCVAERTLHGRGRRIRRLLVECHEPPTAVALDLHVCRSGPRLGGATGRRRRPL